MQYIFLRSHYILILLHYVALIAFMPGGLLTMFLEVCQGTINGLLIAVFI